MSAPTPLPSPHSQKPRPPLSRRRDKKQLSCDFCRYRKLKCDRRQPCSACTARGLQCRFPSPGASVTSVAEPAAPRSSGTAPVPAAPGPAPANLEDRVKSLENLILSTLTAVRRQQPDAEAEPASPLTARGPSPGPPAPESGTLHRSTNRTVYIGSPHWAAIMDGIAELKDHFEHADETRTSSEQGHGPSTGSPAPSSPLLLYSNVPPPSKEQLISELPDKSVVDRMVFRYFGEMSISPLNTLHPPTFLRQYESFWADPWSTPVNWVGLLYSIMCISTTYSIKSEEQAGDTLFNAEGRSVHPKYLQQVVHCLKLGDYIRGGPHVIETLVHYSLIDFLYPFRLPDRDSGNWVISGLMTQLAMRMGYHRDPCHFPEISCFEGEMRRRLWAMIHICDTSFSVLSGAPRLIADGSWDTKPPRNLHDSDFGPDCTSLPESRPDAELTPISFPLARYKLSLSLGWLIDASVLHSFQSPAEMRRAEARLEATWASIHPRFKFISLTQCLAETPAGIGQRLGITCLYDKLHIMLHMRNLLGSRSSTAGNEPRPEGDDAEYEAYSRRKCIEAALQSIECVLLLDAEMRPGGALATVKNKLTALAVHEFMVATAVLGTFLYRFGTAPIDDDMVTGIDMARIESVLRQSKESWVRWSPWSSDAKRAVDMLDLVFRKLEGSAVTAPLNEFSMALDGLGLNFGWDADDLGLFGEGTDMLVS